MTSGVQASAGVCVSGAAGFSVGVAIPIAGFTGFISGSGGSVSPASFKGRNIDACGTTFSGSLTDFEFSLDGGGVLAQNFFKAVLVQRTNGTWVRYETSAASFGAGASTWIWGSGSNPVWTAAPATRLMILYP